MVQLVEFAVFFLEPDTKFLLAVFTMTFPGHLIIDMPDELTFYQKTGSQEFYPLEKIKFRKAEVKFAPSWDNERLGFLLVLTGTNDRIVDVGMDAEIILPEENNVSLFL